MAAPTGARMLGEDSVVKQHRERSPPTAQTRRRPLQGLDGQEQGEAPYPSIHAVFWTVAHASSTRKVPLTSA
jgi:hypothetical protein